jgi:hypothetical protein
LTLTIYSDNLWRRRATNNYWFKRRRYGYGWIPVSWQGWSVVGIYLIVLIGGSMTLVNEDTSGGDPEFGVFFIYLLVATGALMLICIRKGPKPKWRWGKKPTDNPTEDT